MQDVAFLCVRVPIFFGCTEQVLVQDYNARCRKLSAPNARRVAVQIIGDELT